MSSLLVRLTPERMTIEVDGHRIIEAPTFEVREVGESELHISAETELEIEVTKLEPGEVH